MPRLKRKWTPHAKQAEILDSDARFRAVAAGRRFGKTRLARGELIERAFERPGSLNWFLAPSHGDAKELGFDPILEAVPASLLDGAKNEQKESPPREIDFANGSRIVFKSFNGKKRGRGPDFVVVDEAGDEAAPADMWSAEIRPSLSGNGGEALIIGTPNGENWFYQCYERGQDSQYAEWASWQAPSYDNPHVPDDEIDNQRRTIPDRVFRQEYLAEFVDDEGAVFPNPDSVTRPYTLGSVSGTGPYVTGVDLARTSNYLAVTTLDADGMLVGFERTRGHSWAQAGRFLESYLTDYPGVCYLDATRDNKIIEDLSRTVREVQIEPVRFSPQAKAEMVENLAARLETADIVLPESGVDTLRSELRAFEFETTPAGNVRYGAPEGMNDDTVDALALAAKESKVAKSTW